LIDLLFSSQSNKKIQRCSGKDEGGKFGRFEGWFWGMMNGEKIMMIYD